MTRDEEININLEYFKAAARHYIHRDGLEALLSYLENKTDFFRAPASAKHHLNITGGLCLHSINVFETLLRIYKAVYEPKWLCGDVDRKAIEEESLAIVALFHDVCKCNLYQPTHWWTQDEYNEWSSHPGYREEDEFPLGRGEKSCFIVSHYLRLTREEMLAIRWHRGMADIGEVGSIGRKNFFQACQNSPLVCLLQAADGLSSMCIEKTFVR